MCAVLAQDMLTLMFKLMRHLCLLSSVITAINYFGDLEALLLSIHALLPHHAGSMTKPDCVDTSAVSKIKVMAFAIARTSHILHRLNSTAKIDDHSIEEVPSVCPLLMQHFCQWFNISESAVLTISEIEMVSRVFADVRAPESWQCPAFLVI